MYEIELDGVKLRIDAHELKIIKSENTDLEDTAEGLIEKYGLDPLNKNDIITSLYLQRQLGYGLKYDEPKE